MLSDPERAFGTRSRCGQSFAAELCRFEDVSAAGEEGRTMTSLVRGNMS